MVNTLTKLKFDMAQVINKTTVTNLSLENLLNAQFQNTSSNMIETLNNQISLMIFSLLIHLKN